MRSYVQGKGRGAWQEMHTPAIGPYDALVRPTVVATCSTNVHLIETVAP
jgi:isopropanol dehydrogenase (NADP+)